MQIKIQTYMLHYTPKPLKTSYLSFILKIKKKKTCFYIDFVSFQKYWQCFHLCMRLSPENQHVITKQVAEEHTTSYAGVRLCRLNHFNLPCKLNKVNLNCV